MMANDGDSREYFMDTLAPSFWPTAIKRKKPLLDTTATVAASCPMQLDNYIFRDLAGLFYQFRNAVSVLLRAN